MKYNILKTLFLISFYLSISVVQAQDSISKKEQRKARNEQAFIELKPVLEGLNYDFDATKANPQSGKQVDLSTHTSYLKMINDSIDVYLPFYGRAYNAAYGGSGGIECSGNYADYSLKVDEKRQTYIIKFKCKGEGDTYEFSLTVSHSGSGTLSVISTQRAGISYYGQIEQIKTKE